MSFLVPLDISFPPTAETYMINGAGDEPRTLYMPRKCSAPESQPLSLYCLSVTQNVQPKDSEQRAVDLRQVRPWSSQFGVTWGHQHLVMMNATEQGAPTWPPSALVLRLHLSWARGSSLCGLCLSSCGVAVTAALCSPGGTHWPAPTLSDGLLSTF